MRTLNVLLPRQTSPKSIVGICLSFWQREGWALYQRCFFSGGSRACKYPIFASAGIVGVHRGVEKSMDISSDLIQFTRSKVAVVCAGANNILDLGLTMEFLETHCVPVISYKFDYFPAFYCRSSGLRSPHRLDDEAMIA